MSDLTNSEYFARRADEAWSMSKSATDPRAAKAHAAMAEQYESLASEFASDWPSRRHFNGQSQPEA